MLDYNKHCHKDHYQNIKKQWISCPDCDLCFRNELVMIILKTKVLMAQKKSFFFRVSENTDYSGIPEMKKIRTKCYALSVPKGSLDRRQCKYMPTGFNIFSLKGVSETSMHHFGFIILSWSMKFIYHLGITWMMWKKIGFLIPLQRLISQLNCLKMLIYILIPKEKVLESGGHKVRRYGKK